MNFITRLFQRKHNKMVQYPTKANPVKAKPVRQADGSIELKIAGEDYNFRGLPRNHILHGPMAPLKRWIKNMIIEELIGNLPELLPNDQLAEPIGELARCFDLLIEAEEVEEMKRRWKLFKSAICMFLETGKKPKDFISGLGIIMGLKKYAGDMVVKHLVECLPHMTAEDQLAGPVREITRVINMGAEIEMISEIKELWDILKAALPNILQEDDAYRFRAQWVLEKIDMSKIKLSNSEMNVKEFDHTTTNLFRFQWFISNLNIKKIKLTEGDRYYFRAKSFAVDS